jgi:putative hydrolase of the HAD superfamily
MNKSKITHLFVDIGGVLLTNGWDRYSRKLAATQFHLDWDDFEDRHRAAFEIFEVGKITLEEYLNLVVFYKKRKFTRVQFRRFIFEQSKPFPEMIDLIRDLKAKYGLKVVIVSNEAKEINDYRVKKFKLRSFVDVLISSSNVHLRKPEVEIYHMALSISLAQPDQVIYIENTPIFVEIAESLGIKSILHTDCDSTSKKLKSFGFVK